jgi:DNA-binding transcriptional LysR family regulator
MLLSYLRVFCDIVETGSFSKAAMRNFVSQPAVSQQVKALEEHFHQKLIERSPQGVTPTQAGKTFYEGALAILERYSLLEREMLDLTQTVSGEVRVMSIYSVGLHDLPPYVKRFVQTYPQAHLHIEYSRTNKIYESVRQNLCDFGIVAYPQESRQLGIIPLESDEMVVVANPSHPFAATQGEVMWSALEGQRFIAFTRDIPTRRALERLLEERSIGVDVVMEVDNVETIKRSVEAGVGISIVPRRTVGQEVRAGTLIAQSLEGRPPRPIGVIFKRGKAFSLTLQRFLDILLETRA